jgi:oligopeptide/dipeptide ABC transporter ATP-binding protein
MSDQLLQVDGLTVEFHTPRGIVRAVNDVSFDVFEGEILGVVGESGSGKSVSMLSALRLVPEPPARIVAGRAWLGGMDLLAASEDELAKVRGRDVAFVFQDPMTSMNPLKRVGWQIGEAIRTHEPSASKREVKERVVDLLREVDIPNPELRSRQYPHEFSGGMRQRAMIALAMANRPKLLIADEPTTALDVTIQAQVLSVLREIQARTKAATVLITHDLGLIADLADRVMVMYGGRVVEQGPVADLYERPFHPYTQGLLGSLPRLRSEVGELIPIPGQPPNPLSLPSGCAFEPRCGLGKGREECEVQLPGLLPVAAGRLTRCHFSSEMHQ